ncbi:MAG: site-specific integrase [Phycisphaerae bacterium]|jgi:site-specific recombinase XerD
MMITQMFPRDFQKYLDLPVLGSLMDAYAVWLFEQQYTRSVSQRHLNMAARVCKFLKSRGIHCVEDVSESDLQDCYQSFRRKFPRAGRVHVLMRFLVEQAMVQLSPAPEPSHKEILLNKFLDHLREERGCVSSTVRQQGSVISKFLDLLKYEETHNRLASLSITDIEDFIQHMTKRMGRVSLRQVISILRNFLCFLVVEEVIPPGLENQVDAPCIYRQEKLPRSLPWSTVRAFLQSIDRNTAIGKRDYAIFSLIATYGLRACDVANLKLEDIKWRAKCIRIHQTKTGSPLELPLIDEVGSVLYNYLKGVPRYGDYRHVFLRLEAPGGILKSQAIIGAFGRWAQKSGLDIPCKGTHCLRHSFALHMCRRDISLKTIGDILGHRIPESTSGYIRLKTEDLREVALNVPLPVEVQKEVY